MAFGFAETRDKQAKVAEGKVKKMKENFAQVKKKQKTNHLISKYSNNGKAEMKKKIELIGIDKSSNIIVILYISYNLYVLISLTLFK